jgi:pimeloyl-ACP methyl ester carboxylesterase
MDCVISKDGTRIAYEKIGEGAPVILVDGAMCHRSMGRLAARLSNKYTVLSYDRRGRGESGDTQPYAVQREIEDLDALIAEAGGSAYVYGISSGAVLALKAAGSLGSKIRKLAVYEPPFTSGEAARHAADSYTRSLADLLAHGRHGDAVELFMRTVGVPPEAIAGMRHAPMWPAMEAIAPTLAYDDAIMDGGAVPVEAAGNVAVPVIVLDGGRSPAFMREAADTLARAIPSAQRNTLADQTHDVGTEALAPVLELFFEQGM